MDNNFAIDGEGSPVVLIHGSMATKEQWHRLARDLLEQHTVIRYDLMGYGNTPPPESLESYSLGDESFLLESLLDDLAPFPNKYHVVGHSYGGAIALHHAHYHRDRVRSLTLMEPMSYHLLPKNHNVLVSSEIMIKEVRADIERGEAGAGARKFIDLWSRPGTYDNLSEREKKTLEIGVKKMVYDFQAASRDSLTLADYATLPMPVCLVTGKDSPAISLSIANLIGACIPEIEHRTVDGGHFAPFTHTHQVHPVVKAFISTHDKTVNQSPSTREKVIPATS